MTAVAPASAPANATRRRVDLVGLLAAAAVGGLMVIGAVIRWHNIGDQSLWLDELASVTVALSPADAFFAGVRSHPATAPLDYVGLRAVLDAVGFNTVAARVWAFGWGVATIGLVFAATRELVNDRRAALVAAALATASPFLAYYSQEARPYAMSAAMGVVVIWAYARLARLRRRFDWFVLGLVAILAVYTHYFLAVFLVVSGVTFLLPSLWETWRRRRAEPTASAPASRRPVRPALGLASVGAVTAIAFSPWFFYATRIQLGVLYEYPPLAPLSISTWARVFGTIIAAVPRAVPIGGDQPADVVLTAAVLGLAAIGAWALARRRPESAAAMTIIVIGLVPLVWFLDARAGYFVSERQFIFLVPLLDILGAIGLVWLADRLGGIAGRRRFVATRRGPGRAVPIVAAIVGTVLLVAAATPGIDRVYAGDFRPKEDWRAAALDVEARLCPGATVYVNVGPGFSYGIGLYAPEIASRITYLQELDINEYLGQILQRYPIERRDTVVILRDRPGTFVAGQGDLQTVTDQLFALGLRAEDFTSRLRVFRARGSCPAG